MSAAVLSQSRSKKTHAFILDRVKAGLSSRRFDVEPRPYSNEDQSLRPKYESCRYLPGSITGGVGVDGESSGGVVGGAGVGG